ncbi:hypothetical protein SKAU_G00261750 [Synaphobranchus kaupii]|uniref:Uncharacterized protein n=1 Tax=Synaphobranchus kaupii TaxID=118154 RepID=A0A9Q1EYM3_SYNKA|nr:hypothetical protein SKAU_G00261750 [Synaphobranchus kaupii]
MFGGSPLLPNSLYARPTSLRAAVRWPEGSRPGRKKNEMSGEASFSLKVQSIVRADQIKRTLALVRLHQGARIGDSCG